MANDALVAVEGLGVTVGSSLPERVGWSPRLTLRKYDEAATLKAERQGFYRPSDEDFAQLRIDPYEVRVTDGNLLTTAGIGRIVSLLTGGGGQTVISTSARVGAGNSSTAEAIGQTDLQAAAGSTNRWFQTCTVTTPSNVLTLAATFGTADGNFVWAEWCIDVGTPTVASGNTVSALMLNRKVAANGTKAPLNVHCFPLSNPMAVGFHPR